MRDNMFVTKAGDFDFCGLLVGPPKHGKTALTAELCARALEAGVWVFAHDQNHQFRRMCGWYDNAAAWRRAADEAWQKKRPMPRGASFGCRLPELVELVTELGNGLNRKRGLNFPMMLVVDEGSSSKSGSSHITEAEEELLAQRRHLGVALSYNLQRPTMLTAAFRDLSTDLFLFLQTNANQVRALEETLPLVKPGQLHSLTELPKFHYLHYVIGEGVI